MTTIKVPEQAPNARGVFSCPGPAGGVEWNGPAYDHLTEQLSWARSTGVQPSNPTRSSSNPGVLARRSREWDTAKTGWVTAVNPDSGAVRWKYHADAPVVAAITPTAGGVTFTGDMDGSFFAFESATGKLLFNTATGGALAGGVITYALGGTQYVAITSGNVSRLSFGESGKPTLIIYALPERAKTAATSPSPQTTAATAPTTVTAAAAPPDAGRGKELFLKNCAACHGNQGEGGSGPALKGVRTRLDFASTVNWIENPSRNATPLSLRTRCAGGGRCGGIRPRVLRVATRWVVFARPYNL